MMSARRWFRISTVASVALTFAAAAVCPAAEPADQEPESPAAAIVIRGGLLFDAIGTETRANDIFVIEKAKITGMTGEATIPADPVVIDAAGLTILPGLIDMHVHFGAPAGDDASADPAALMAEYFQQRPRVRTALLAAGVTSIRSVGDVVGNQWWGIVGLKASTKNGRLSGPRVFAAGPLFTAPDGHPAATLYRTNAFLVENATRQVTDPKLARRMVSDLAALGLNGIKAVYDDGGGRLPRLDRSVLEAIIDEAHRRDLWVAVHTGSNSEVRHALIAGADTIEHGVTDATPVDQQTLSLLKEHKATYVPTLAVAEAIWGKADKPSLRQRYEQRLKDVRNVHQAGIMLAAGSDTQGAQMQFGSSLHRELELLVEAGLTPAEALQAATRNAAAALKVEKQLGTLEVGKTADVVLVEGDATQNIEAVSNVRMVIQQGRIVVDNR